MHDGGSHRPSRFIAESAWQDSMQVAECLAKSEPTSAVLRAASPAIVERYLERLGRDDITFTRARGEGAPGRLCARGALLPRTAAASRRFWCRERLPR